MPSSDYDKLPFIAKEEIWRSNPLLESITQKIGIRKKDQFKNLMVVILLPFILTSIAAYSERCFFLGDVVADSEIAILDAAQYRQLRYDFQVCFGLKERAFSALKKRGAPESSIAGLRRLNNYTYAGTDHFLAKAKTHFEADDFKRFRHIFNEHLETKVILKGAGNSSGQKRYISVETDFLSDLITKRNIARDVIDVLSSEIREYLIEKELVHNVEIIGMSYLGDPMVWPFYVFVPWALIALAYAIQRVERFFKKIRYSIDIGSNDDNEKTYGEMISRAKEGFAAVNHLKLLKYLGLVIGISFITWNTFTCTFPETVHPYQSNRAYCRIDGETSNVELLNKIDIPKWDTNVKEDTFSWICSRLWVIFGYCMIPVLLAKLINIIVVIYFFSSKLGKNNLLIIKPLSPDRAGGFAFLSDAAISFVYMIIPFLMMLIVSFMKESTPASFHNYLLVIFFIPIFLLVFFIPLISFHVAMKTAKTRYLQVIAFKFNSLNDLLLDDICKQQINTESLEKQEKYLGALKNMYDQVANMTEWPLEFKTVYRFVGSFSIPPVITAALQYFLKTK
jgi:hypothetical protein